jgi:HD-GYP domain-containing protein (c-di-GMP phosphodiesterase class II)
MAKLAQRIAGVVAFVVAFVGVRQLISYYRLQTAASKATSTMEKLRTDAARSHPELPAEEALMKQGLSETERTLASKPTLEGKAQAAADMFWGYYWINTRSRASLCETLRVNLGKFVSEMERVNASELAQAHRLYERSSITEDQLWSAMRPAFEKQIVAEMDATAKQYGLSIPELCKRLDDNAASVVGEMTFSKRNPPADKALLEAK